ncbi:MAG: murein biosynthesis integral membrane protein MurJ, partial [Actinomycetota bacterium]
MSEERDLVRATGVMSVGTALSRITGFLRLAAMAYALGITETRLADAYSIANITPNILYELALGGILTSVVVPVVVEWTQTHGREAAWDAVRRLLTLAALALGGLAVVAIVAAPWIVDLYTVRVAGADREAVRQLATFFLRWFMPQILFYGVGAIATGLLNAHRRFAAPMFAPILNNLVVIATFGAFALMPGPAAGSGQLATTAQELVLAIGTTLGVVTMTLALLPSVRDLGFRFEPRFGLDAAMRKIGALAGWVFVYVLANQAGYLVVLVLAAGTQGGYTAYASAFMLFQLPHAIFAVSIFTALLPALSSRWSTGDVEGFRNLLARGLRATGAIVLPAALGYLVLSREIVRVLLEHGATGAASGDLVASVLAAFAIGLVPFSAFQLLLRAFYAVQDTRTPALVNLVALAVNVGANLFLAVGLELGVRGLAYGHAASYLVGSALLYWMLRKKVGALPAGSVGPALGRSLVAAVVTAAAAWGVQHLTGGWFGSGFLGGTVSLVLAIGAGLAVFVGAAMLLDVDEVRAALG